MQAKSTRRRPPDEREWKDDELFDLSKCLEASRKSNYSHCMPLYAHASIAGESWSFCLRKRKGNSRTILRNQTGSTPPNAQNRKLKMFSCQFSWEDVFSEDGGNTSDKISMRSLGYPKELED